MELNELLKKIMAMQAAAKSRVNGQSSESMQLYIQGFCDGLDGVVITIKKAIEAERMRQRLAKLESELAQDPEPGWSQMPNGSSTVPSADTVPVAPAPGALGTASRLGSPADTV